MSEATIAATSPADAVVHNDQPTPLAQRDPRYSYDAKGVLRRDKNGNPKPKGAPKGKKKTLKEYTTPAGGLQSHETPGFDVNEMRQLKQSQFADVLDFAKWRVWYYQQKLEAAQREVATVQASGATAEERRENSRAAALVTQLEKMMASGKGNKFASRIGELFAKMEAAN